MSALGNIVKKELRELLTPATFLPIIIMALIFGSMGSTLGGIEEELAEKPIIGYINEDDGNFSEIATSVINSSAEVVSIDGDDKQKGLEQVMQEGGVALIIIPQNFTDEILSGKQGVFEIYWIMKGAGLMDSISSDVVEGLIDVININISKELIESNSSMNATIALSPTTRNETTYFKDKDMKGLSPGEISGMLSAQSTMIPIVMMMIILMAGGTVISSMALEKENKTLETLLTLPVKRTSIVAGKIAASAAIGLLFAIVYMFGIGYYMQSFQMEGGINLADYGLVLTPLDLLLIGILLFVTLIAALSLCMLLGTMAKNYKSAQTLTFPVTMLAVLPMFITMFKDFDTLPLALKGILYVIPFSHPMMAPRALIFGDYLLVLSGIIYVSIFAIVTILIVVWVFKTDRLLTGSVKKRKFFSFRNRFV